MQLHSHRSGGTRRLALGLTVTAALAVTLAACSGSGGTSGGTGTQVTGTQQSPAAAGAASPAASSPAAAAASSNLPGTWSGQYSGAFQGTFVLRWHQSGSRLSGRITLSNPSQTVPINGRVIGGAIKFGTVGSTVITYSGSVSGGHMSGTYHVHTPTGSVGGPWSAGKSS